MYHKGRVLTLDIAFGREDEGVQCLMLRHVPLFWTPSSKLEGEGTRRVCAELELCKAAAAVPNPINENVLRFINTPDNSEQQGGSWLSYSEFTAFSCIPSNKTNDAL